jgi:HK97 family phage portal protein
MSLFGSIRPRAMTSDELSRLILSTYGGGHTSTGISVTTDSAMRAITVQSCVTIKANSLAQLPCHLYAQNGKSKELAVEHPYYTLLHDQPNEWMTAPEFWGMVSACLDLRGNFFALKSGLPGRQIRELIPLPIGAVEEVIQTPSYGLFYKVRRPKSNSSTSDATQSGIGLNAGTEADMIPGNRIMHIRGLVLNGFMGLNPIAYARESIGLALAQEKHGAKLFKNGAMLHGIVKAPGRFKTDAEAKKWIENFNDAFASVESAWKTALLEDGMSYERIGMTSEDSQFMEARAFQKKEIVDLFFGLPLQMMTSGDKTATFASAQEFDSEYVTFCMVPRIVNIEKAIRRDMLNDEEKKTMYAKFQTGGLMRGKIKERFEAYQIAVNTEIFSPNEARELEDMNPYEGGDEYRTRTSTMKQPAEPAKGADKK